MTDQFMGEDTPPTILVQDAEAVVAMARQQLGKPYKLSAEGPDQFDCSGLVWFCFRSVGLKELLGTANDPAQRRRARGYYRVFHDAGLIVKSVKQAERGDLVFYGWTEEDEEGGLVQNNVTHIGIYTGGYRRRTISALRNPLGVTRHRFNALTTESGNQLPVVGFARIQYDV